MNLPAPEQQVYDVLRLHSPNWIVSGDIAITLGHYQNYICKLLSFLINKGLVESRPVENNGKIEHYCEYRLKANTADLREVTPTTQKLSQRAEMTPQNDSKGQRDRYLRLNSFATTFTLLHGCLNCAVYYRKATMGLKCKICL